MKELKRIGLYGLRGAGKSSIITSLVKKVYNVYHMDGTSFILQAANMSLEDFKAEPEDRKRLYREKAIDLAFAHQNKIRQHFLTAGHLAFPNKKGEIVSVMTGKDKEFYTEFVYMDLPPEIINERQNKDRVKKRSYPLEVISNWLSFEKEELSRVCQEEKIPLHFLRELELEACVDFLIKIIKE